MMDKKHLLLIEDEPFLAKVIEDSFIQNGFKVIHTSDGEKGYNLARNGNFDIIVLDVMLPVMDGFSVAKQLRRIDSETPILFLTAKNETESVVDGYKSGGNDYLKKPFSLEELFLRVDELLKRYNKTANGESEDIVIGKYNFNYLKQELIFNQQIIRLSHKETELLKLLCKNRNGIADRKSVLLSIWGDDNFFNTRTMDVFITRLRKHLKSDPEVEILNIRGLGYKLIC